MNRIAQIISIVLNPLVVIIAMSYLLTFSWFWGFLTTVFIILLSILIWILVKKKVFSDFDVSKQKQRPTLYFLEFSSALVYLSIIYYLHAPIILISQTLVVILILIAQLFVNKFLKVSGHMAIFSAATMMLVFVYGWPYLLGFIPIGILAWSRLKLKRHSLKEVIAGVIIGIIFSILIAVI